MSKGNKSKDIKESKLNELDETLDEIVIDDTSKENEELTEDIIDVCEECESLGTIEFNEELKFEFEELTSYKYKDTKDPEIIKRRTILANTLLVNQVCKTLDIYGEYIDIENIKIGD